MTMAEPIPQPQIAVVRPVIDRMRHLRGDLALAVDTAMRTIGTEPGEPIDLPNARFGAPYQVQKPINPDAPVIVYRRSFPDEPGDYLVVSLMTPKEFRQQKQDEQSAALRDPAVRHDIAVAAGTAASIMVEAVPGVVTPTPGGAVPTEPQTPGRA